MADLDPQVQIKLIEISKGWAEETTNKEFPGKMPKDYPEKFDEIYKQLTKTVSAAMLEE